MPKNNALQSRLPRRDFLCDLGIIYSAVYVEVVV
jgi:hypothetical protein